MTFGGARIKYVRELMYQLTSTNQKEQTRASGPEFYADNFSWCKRVGSCLGPKIFKIWRTHLLPRSLHK